MNARLAALRNKASARQLAISLCDGHIWRIDHKSQITSGGSGVCVRCGERRDWKDIPDNEPTEFGVQLVEQVK